MQRREQQKPKPFCKVCRDAGKTESVYTSHYVKSKEGIVTCPTLKNVTCRYCHKNGHTVSHCQVLKTQNQQPQKQIQKQIQKPIISRDDFPGLPSSKPSSHSQEVTKSGYADMVRKEPITPPKRKQLPMPIMPVPKKIFTNEEDDYQEEYYDDYKNKYDYEENTYEDEQEDQDLYEEEEEEDYDW
jgi:hypothetical protein